MLKYVGRTLEETLNQHLQGKRRLQKCIVLSESPLLPVSLTRILTQIWLFKNYISNIKKCPAVPRCTAMPCTCQTGISGSLGLQMAEGKKLLVRSASWVVWTSTFTEPCQSHSCQRGLECLCDLLIKITKCESLNSNNTVYFFVLHMHPSIRPSF